MEILDVTRFSDFLIYVVCFLEFEDGDFFSSFTLILTELVLGSFKLRCEAEAEEADEFQSLWDDVRSRKQAIANCAGNCQGTWKLRLGA